MSERSTGKKEKDMLLGTDMFLANVGYRIPCYICGKLSEDKWFCRSCEIYICPECAKEIKPEEDGCPICNDFRKTVIAYYMYDEYVREFFFRSKARKGFEWLRKKYIKEHGWTEYERIWKKNKKGRLIK